MGESQPQFLLVGSGRDERRIAYLRAGSRQRGRPGVVWLGGFKSEMIATKATALAAWAAGRDVDCLRFD